MEYIADIRLVGTSEQMEQGKLKQAMAERVIKGSVNRWREGGKGGDGEEGSRKRKLRGREGRREEER